MLKILKTNKQNNVSKLVKTVINNENALKNKIFYGLDLDEFYKFKRSNKVENSSYVFYHFPIENTLGLNSPSMTLNAEQARD